jgi:hypothetical protein
MKKKHLLATLLTGFVFVLLFLGGCKKELSKDSKNVKKPDLQMSNEAGPGKEPVLRQSPGLKFKVASKTIERILPQLKGVEQIKAKLREGLVKKKTNPAIASTSEASFTAAPAGNNNYFCRGIIRTFDGPRDWYLLNTYTWVYTYIGSTANQDIEFYLDKPLLPGTYGLYAENNTDLGYTNYLSLGDPYTGVTVSGGLLSFTNSAAYNALKTRLRNAYGSHQTLLDAYNLMSNDDAEIQAIADGFDEFLPFKEFEAYFGFSSLRAKIRGEVEYWQTQSNEFGTGYPEDNYIPYSYEQQTLMTIAGQIEVGGVGEGPMSLPLTAGRKSPSNPGPNTCMDEADMAEQRDVTNVRKVKMYVFIDPGTDGGASSTVFTGRTRTMKRQAGFFWKDKLERQQIRISGNQYLACGFEREFDSGLLNTENKLRYKMDVDYSAGVGRQAKSGQITTSVTLNEYTSTPFTLTYTH